MRDAAGDVFMQNLGVFYAQFLKNEKNRTCLLCKNTAHFFALFVRKNEL